MGLKTYSQPAARSPVQASGTLTSCLASPILARVLKMMHIKLLAIYGTLSHNPRSFTALLASVPLTSKMISSSCTLEDFRTIVKDFLHDIGFQLPTKGFDTSFVKEVIHHFSTLPVTDLAARRFEAIAEWVSIGVGVSYPFLPSSTHREISIFTTYLFIIDDYGDEEEDDLQHFTSALVTGQAQPNAILRTFLEFLPSLKAHYGPYAYDMFVKSTIEFINGCLLEQRLNHKFQTPAYATSFPRFFRLKTGYADPYAHFLFPEYMWQEKECLQVYLPCLPDLINYINHSNDLISFYKESILGNERFNYICNYAKAERIPVTEALRRTAEDTLESVRRIRKVLDGHPEMLQSVECFVQGFLTYHLLCPRYRIIETGVLQGDREDLFQEYRNLGSKSYDISRGH